MFEWRMKNLINYIKKKSKNLINVVLIGAGSFGLLVNENYGQKHISTDNCLNQYYNQFSKIFIKDGKAGRLRGDKLKKLINKRAQAGADEQKKGRLVCQDTLANIFVRYIEDLEYTDCSGKINYCNALSVSLIGKNHKTVFIDSENKQDLSDNKLIFNAKVDYVFGINEGKKYMDKVSQEESSIEDYSLNYNLIKKSLMQKGNCW